MFVCSTIFIGAAEIVSTTFIKFIKVSFFPGATTIETKPEPPYNAESTLRF